MCRHLGYLGEPRTLHELIAAPEFSLVHQAFAPRRQVHGRINADGYGVGWWTDVRPEPVRVRRTQPIWTDPSLLDLAQVTSSRAVVAAVRSATPGFAVTEDATAPFREGPWLFSHNGSVEHWERLADTLSRDQLVGLEAKVDSVLVWAMVRSRLADGAEPGAALADVVREVAHITPARLNLILCDGERLAATAFGSSLSWRDLGVREPAGRGSVASHPPVPGVVVASEPYDDDPGWHDVPEGSLVTVDAKGVTVSDLT